MSTKAFDLEDLPEHFDEIVDFLRQLTPSEDDLFKLKQAAAKKTVKRSFTIASAIDTYKKAIYTEKIGNFIMAAHRKGMAKNADDLIIEKFDDFANVAGQDMMLFMRDENGEMVLKKVNKAGL